MDPNPFMIDVVLSTLFEKLSISELKTSRLVCHHWYNLATPQLQYQMLKANKILQLNYENWTHFIHSIGKKGVFWRRVELNGVPMDHLCLTSFPLTYGPRITSLTLVNYYQETPDINDFRRFFSMIPNLEKLSLGALPKEISACSGELFPSQIIFSHLRKLNLFLKSVAYTPNFFQGLLGSAPNLESLSVRDTNSNFGLITLILQTLESQFPKITALKIAQLCELNLFILNNYSERGLKLKKLFLESLTPEVTHGTVSSLLSKQSSSLETLMIGRPSACRSVFLNFTFPFVMPNLQKLDFWTHSLEWGGIHYSKQLPRLQNIVVRGYRSYHNWSIPLPDPNNIVVRSDSVKCVKWIDSQSTDVQVNLWKIYLIFPNITAVSLNIHDPNTLHTLWSLWTTLEDLEIHFDAETLYLDSAFTGILPAVCVEMFNNNPLDLVKATDPRSSIGRLSSLKRLRIFQSSVSSTFGNSHNALTDVTGYMIYNRLINLEEIVISRSMISELCHSKLAQLPKIKTLKIASFINSM